MHTKRIDFSRYSSIGIGPMLDVRLIKTPSDIDNAYTIIGKANNLLVAPTAHNLMVLDKCFDFIRIDEDRLVIGAATPTGKIVSFCRRHDIAYFEFLSKLPGTLGGALAMNAGVKEYEIFNHLHSITTHKGTFEAQAISHGYRYAHIDGVVLEATFTLAKGFDDSLNQELLRLRDNQPHQKSAGSCFKNPPDDYAGRLLEAVGLKGFRIGDMAFSDVHANFLVNLGQGSFEDAMTLITLAQQKVKEKFDKTLENEIIILK